MPTAVPPSPTALPLLDPDTHQTKTIDFGANGLAASLSIHGRFLTIAGPHPVHGQIIVAPWEQFPAEKHYDQPFVRGYRARPMDLHKDAEAGFGMTVKLKSQDGSIDFPRPEWSYIDGSWPRGSALLAQCKTEHSYTVVDGQVTHSVVLQNTTREKLMAEVNIGGPLSLHRAAYTQLTPQGDCSLPQVENHLRATSSGALLLQNRHLPATLGLSVYVEGRLRPMTSSESTTTGTCQIHNAFDLEVPPNSSRHVVVKYTLSPGLEDLDAPASIRITRPSASSNLTSMIDHQRLSALLGNGKRGQVLAFVVLRNLDYLLSCCAMPIVSEAGESKGTCIITDHQCLPLGWNRDNYWQLDMLNSLYPHVDNIVHAQYRATARRIIQDVLRSHLVWVFRTAQRPAGFWARSFFSNGIPKDGVFQLDQQCYPLLELAEYAARFAAAEADPSELDFVKKLARGVVDEVLDCLQEHRWTAPPDSTHGRRLWLFKTDETPADDEVAYPYHFSSHVLLCHTLKSLAQLRSQVGSGCIKTDVSGWAGNVHADTLEFFTTEHPEIGPMFAYLTSTTGQFQFYHDANDLPTALAPRWGFCSVDDQLWRNTIRFAFSPENTDGWYPGGPFGGLGSIHTRDPWPLGDGQRLSILATLGGQTEDPKGVNETIAKIMREAQWDGLFAEAVNRDSGQVTSKNWFSWPGSFISSTLLSQCGVLFEDVDIGHSHT